MDQKVSEVERKRLGYNDKIKKTRFAVPSYKYVEAHTNAN